MEKSIENPAHRDSKPYTCKILKLNTKDINIEQKTSETKQPNQPEAHFELSSCQSRFNPKESLKTPIVSI